MFRRVDYDATDRLPLEPKDDLGVVPTDRLVRRATAYSRSECYAFVVRLFPRTPFIDPELTSILHDLLAYRLMQVVVFDIATEPFEIFLHGTPTSIFRELMDRSFTTHADSSWIAALRARLFLTPWPLLERALQVLRRRVPTTMGSAGTVSYKESLRFPNPLRAAILAVNEVRHQPLQRRFSGV